MSPRAAYAIAALVLFAIEVCIALFVRDAFIRPYVGDVLAVALVYAALRAITPLRPWPAIAAALAIALAIELAQLFNLLDVLGLRSNVIVSVVLGGDYDPMDLAAYGLGALTVVAIERARLRR